MPPVILWALGAIGAAVAGRWLCQGGAPGQCGASPGRTRSTSARRRASSSAIRRPACIGRNRRQARSPSPLQGRGIAYGFEAGIASVGKMDSEDGSRSARGVRWSNSRRLSEDCRIREPPTRSTNCWKSCSSLLAAVLCGAEELLATWRCLAVRKEGLLRQFLALEHGIPSHDTFSRVFRLLDPQAFELAFRHFMAAFAKANGIDLTGVVAIDGKALARAYERGRAQHPAAHGQCLRCGSAHGAWRRARRPGRNEAAGALEVLQMLSTRRLHRHRRCAPLQSRRLPQRCSSAAPTTRWRSRKTRASSSLPSARRFARAASAALPNSANRPLTIAASARRATVIRDTSLAAANRLPGCRRAWPASPRADACGASRAEQAGRTLFTCCPNTSRPNDSCTIVRSHWGIENQLHWVLDVVFDEDANRSQKGQCSREPRDLAKARAQHHSNPSRHRISMRQKIKRAGWDDAFLLEISSVICDSPALAGEGRRAERAGWGLSSFAQTLMLQRSTVSISREP